MQFPHSAETDVVWRCLGEIVAGSVTISSMAQKDHSLDSIRAQYPPIITTAQVAALLGLNVRTVMVMANDGRLPASRLPGSRKYHFILEDVLATLARHRVAQPAPPGKATAKAAGTRSEAAASASPTPAHRAKRPSGR